MPRGTPLRCIRVEEELWAAFGQRAEANGTTRTALMRAWMAAYVAERDVTSDVTRTRKRGVTDGDAEP